MPTPTIKPVSVEYADVVSMVPGRKVKVQFTGNGPQETLFEFEIPSIATSAKAYVYVKVDIECDHIIAG